jgi:hypothetical protein
MGTARNFKLSTGVQIYAALYDNQMQSYDTVEKQDSGDAGCCTAWGCGPKIKRPLCIKAINTIIVWADLICTTLLWPR